jgi:eukaryotic-like serine/threonine-protein kinase
MRDETSLAGPGVGTVLDQAYQLTRLVFEGGMSTVYEALQLKLKRRVAVKIMLAELAENPELVARFRREVKITAKLAHPNVVQLLDFGSTPWGQAYLVTEYLEGEDLEQRMERLGRLPLATAAHIIGQIASALAAIHRKGVIHRDLKPGNVLLVPLDGTTDFVKLVDFGISKLLTSSTQLTRPATVLGTPEYMAPEQALARHEEIDHRTDQWALACTAWRMLSGRAPFSGLDVEDTLRRIVDHDPPSLLESAPHLTVEVDRVLRRGLAKRPTQRFANVTAFSRAFEAAAIACARLTGR